MRIEIDMHVSNVYNVHVDLQGIISRAGNFYIANVRLYSPATGTPPSQNPFRYAGEYFDSHRGEYYLRARHFNPRLGRFTQADPFWGIHNHQDGPWAIMQAGNLFVYTANNPVMFIDPSGLVLRISGTVEERDAILADLNSLTRDNLELTLYSLDTETGVGVWTVSYTEGWGNNLGVGTSLIREIIAEDDVTTISSDFLRRAVDSGSEGYWFAFVGTGHVSGRVAWNFLVDYAVFGDRILVTNQRFTVYGYRWGSTSVRRPEIRTGNIVTFNTAEGGECSTQLTTSTRGVCP